jgi:Tol biopolymer transport system component/C-terminal processing protease CtpA/Prc
MLTALLVGSIAFAQVAARPTFYEPAIRPDGAVIAFVSGGDIWTVPAAGGQATLLIAHPAHESRPLYSPDGTRLAFVSERSGNGDLYVFDTRSGALTRVTFDDAAEQLGGWSPDGQWLYFNSTARDVAGMHDVLRVRATGGTPMVVAGDRYASEYWAAPSPDGSALAITARGTVPGQWWRNGHSHIDESEIWLVRAGDGTSAPQYTRIGEAGGGKDAWPMWSADGRQVFYMSDREQAENLWVRASDGSGTARRLTNFRDGRVLWPTITRAGDKIAFERDFGIWTLEVGSGRTQALPITLGASIASPPAQRTVVSTGFTFAVAPDGRKLALATRGDLFGVSARDGGDAERAATSVGLTVSPLWLPDSRRVLFAAWREGMWALYRYDFGTRSETRLSPSGDAFAPALNRAGTKVAYVQDGTEIRVMDVDGSNDHRVAQGSFRRPPFMRDRGIAWSPDGEWIAYLVAGDKGFTNAWVVPAAGGTARQVSFLASTNGNGIEWSGDGTFLLYETSQRTEETQLVRVDLVPRAPQFREDAFRGLFEQGAARSASATPRDTTTRAVPMVPRIEFDGIRTRASRISVGLPLGAKFLSPDGKTVVFTSSGGGSSNLYAYSLEPVRGENAVPRQLTTTTTGKGNVVWTLDGREVWFSDGGRISAVNVESRAVRTVAASAAVTDDFLGTRMGVFEQAWSWQRDWFYDPAMHGADWPAVRTRFAPQVAGARTPEELRRVLNLMVGELNASHSGISGPSSAGVTEPVGRLGAAWDRVAYEQRGQVRIAELIPFGPLALAGGVGVGDVITAIDSVVLDATTNLDAVLRHTTGRKVVLTLVTGSAAPRRVAVQPISGGAEKQLLYSAWVESRRAYVHRVSEGRLGYVHMLDMSEQSLQRLYNDLDTENYARDGVVIDIRNNNGGFVNAYALDVFTRRPYLTLTGRGNPSAPGRMQLGQRSLEKPTILVTNQHSLSDAEDFTEGYRTLGLGKVVGEPTSGWIVYTSNVTLLDGTTSMRMPTTRVDGTDGKNMELNPRPVDVAVERPVGEAYSGRDSQLDAAVRELLAALKR